MSKKLSFLILGLSLAFFVFGAFFFFRRPSTDSNSNITLASLNGFIDLNGYVPANATLNILAKKVTDTDFQLIIKDLSATDGTPWSYDQAISGQAYELQAYIQLSDGTKSDYTPIKTTVAPAQDLRLMIDSTHQPPEPAKGDISGFFDINGYYPTGSQLALYYSIHDENEWQLVTKIAVKDKEIWTLSDAIKGNNYDFQTHVLDNNGKTLFKSEIISALAPASNERMRLNSQLSPPQPKVTSSAISGNFKFNGPLPSNATISLGVRKTGTEKFEDIFHGVSASDNLAWKFDQAQTGQKYDIQGYLWVNGQPFSQSQVLTVSAPADHEVLTIQAQTPPPVPNAGTLKVSCVKQELMPGQQKNELYQVKIEYNTNRSLQKVQQYRLRMGYSVDGTDLLDTIITPNNPDEVQTFTTGNILPKNNVAYIRYATSTCASCNTFSAFSPAVQISCQD